MNPWDVPAEIPAVLVRLRFEPDAGFRLLKSRYPNMVDPLILVDGRVELDFRVEPDDTRLPRELLGWILSWGQEVEVLDPPDLQQAWRAALRVGPEQRGLKVRAEQV